MKIEITISHQHYCQGHIIIKTTLQIRLKSESNGVRGRNKNSLCAPIKLLFPIKERGEGWEIRFILNLKDISFYLFNLFYILLTIIFAAFL